MAALKQRPGKHVCLMECINRVGGGDAGYEGTGDSYWILGGRKERDD